MNVTVFTSNQPRHVALIDALAGVADRVYAIQECNTVFPGQVADFFARSAVMQAYFSRVQAAERALFGAPSFPSRGKGNVSQLAIKMGDLNRLSVSDLGPAMDADVFVVFGASFIRGPLCQRLIDRRAINIHMGISPQYRGSSCNFWALYDGNPHLVGATLHLLSSGLDSGPMIRHALPPAEVDDGFELGMAAVAAAHTALIELIRSGDILAESATPQRRTGQISYTRNADFNDTVAAEYLARPAVPGAIRRCLAERDASGFLRPFVPAPVSRAA